MTPRKIFELRQVWYKRTEKHKKRSGEGKKKIVLKKRRKREGEKRIKERRRGDRRGKEERGRELQ